MEQKRVIQKRLEFYPDVNDKKVINVERKKNITE